MGIRFEFDNPNRLYSQVERMLRDRGQAIQQIPDRAIRRGIFELLALIQADLPKRTSTLVRSVTAVVVQVSKDVLEGKVGSPMKYARYLEEGTGVFGPKGTPITILPRSRKGLYWGAFDSKGKALVRTRAVVQGIKPRGYFANATSKFIPRYLEIIQDEVRRIPK